MLYLTLASAEERSQAPKFVSHIPVVFGAKPMAYEKDSRSYRLTNLDESFLYQDDGGPAARGESPLTLRRPWARLSMCW